MSGQSNSITILGEFYDSYVYMKTLRLITADKKILSIDWQELVTRHMPHPNHIGYDCAFLNGKYLYGAHFQKLFSDEGVKQLLLKRFSEIEDIIVPYDEIKPSRKVSEFEHLPADISAYNNYLYYCDANGLHRCRMTAKNIDVANTETVVQGMHVVSIDIASGFSIRYATLDKGLWEFDAIRSRNQYGPVLNQLTMSHTSFSRDNHASILVGSYYAQSKFIERVWERENDPNSEKGYRNVLVVKDEHNLSEVFGMDGFFISAYDKIYLLNEQGIFLARFEWSNDNRTLFSENEKSIERIGNGVDLANLVDATVEFFGVVVEYRNKVQVLLSTGKIFEREFAGGQFVGWRTFPRSIDYTNQLHLIFSDRIEIHSFNEDYFVNQKEKKLGMKWR